LPQKSPFFDHAHKKNPGFWGRKATFGGAKCEILSKKATFWEIRLANAVFGVEKRLVEVESVEKLLFDQFHCFLIENVRF